MNDKKTQKKQVFEALKKLNSFASLEDIYGKVDTSKWGARDPKASARGILQYGEEFFSIRRGYWILLSEQDRIQKHQVIRALKRLDKQASLQEIYKEVDYSAWNTDTPKASINRILHSGENELFVKKEKTWKLNKSNQLDLVVGVMKKEKNKGGMNLNEIIDQLDFSSPVWDGSKKPTDTVRGTINRDAKKQKGKIKKVAEGFYVLKKDEPDQGKINNSKKEDDKHGEYQAKLLELGETLGYKSFIPKQDANRRGVKKILKDNAYAKDACGIEIIKKTFGIKNKEGKEDKDSKEYYIYRKARTIDLSWYEDDKPRYLFEVEHTTDMTNSLVKFTDLMGFESKPYFFIVAREFRRNDFEEEIRPKAFDGIRDRVKFISYQEVDDYIKQAEKYFPPNKKN